VAFDSVCSTDDEWGITDTQQHCGTLSQRLPVSTLFKSFALSKQFITVGTPLQTKSGTYGPMSYVTDDDHVTIFVDFELLPFSSLNACGYAN